MLELGLSLFLLTAPLVDRDRPLDPGARLPERAMFDPCAEAERIAAQGPCLRAEDCGALRSWERLFGTPRIEPLEPQLAAGAPRREVTTSFVCLARAASRARPPAHR